MKSGYPNKMTPMSIRGTPSRGREIQIDTDSNTMDTDLSEMEYIAALNTAAAAEDNAPARDPDVFDPTVMTRCTYNRGHTCQLGDLIDDVTGKEYVRCALHREHTRKYRQERRRTIVKQRLCSKCRIELDDDPEFSYEYVQCMRCRYMKSDVQRQARRKVRDAAARELRIAKLRAHRTKVHHIQTCTDARLIQKRARKAGSHANPTEVRIAAVTRKATFLGPETLTATERAMLKKATVSSNDPIQ